MFDHKSEKKQLAAVSQGSGEKFVRNFLRFLKYCASPFILYWCYSTFFYSPPHLEVKIEGSRPGIYQDSFTLFSQTGDYILELTAPRYLPSTQESKDYLKWVKVKAAVRSEGKEIECSMHESNPKEIFIGYYRNAISRSLCSFRGKRFKKYTVDFEVLTVPQEMPKDYRLGLEVRLNSESVMDEVVLSSLCVIVLLFIGGIAAILWLILKDLSYE